MEDKRRIKQFSLFLERSDRAKTTKRRLVTNLERLFRDIESFSKEEVDDFFLRTKERFTPSYRNSLVCSIRVYAQFLELDKELQNYPFFKKDLPIKATLSDEEIVAFLNLPAEGCESRKTHQFYTVFFSVMAFTGMRPGEVAKLTLNDVDFGRGVFLVRHTKTRDNRLVPIPPNIENLLREHLKTVKRELVFSKKYSERPITNEAWHYNFHKRIKKMGIKRTNLTPYSLRHSLITRLLEEDVNIFKVQKIVGHRDIKTTAIYTHLTTKDIIRAIKRHPIVRRSEDPESVIRNLKEMIEVLELEKDKRFSYKLVTTEKSLRLEARLHFTSHQP